MIESGFRSHGIDVDTVALIRSGSIGQRLGHLWQVAAHIFKGRYDAVFSYHAAAGLMMAIIGPIAGVEKRLSHLTAMPEAIRRRWRIMDKLAGVSGGYTDIIANSAATAAAYSQFPSAFRKRMRIIPHGVIPVAKATGQKDWRKALAISPQVKVMVAVGRLAPQKDHATVLKALPQLPNLHFVIAGDGPLRQELASMASELKVHDRVHFLGSIDRAELGGVFAIADLYLSSSTWETFGLAAVEAQMAGLPIVASDLPVLREVLGATGRERTLILHPVGDAQAFVRAVETFLDNPPDARELEEVAEAARAHHGVDAMVQTYLDLLAEPDHSGSGRANGR
nr:glycosyltransferase family 4 protein [Neorhizobium lilium]